MKPVSMLPNALTLANAGCGLLAISKAIDALAGDQANFAHKLETSCWLILLAGVFDALDGKLARLTDSFTEFGAQLDSFADALTFGVAPALLTKVLLEHEGWLPPRVHFLAAASFALMAILRLARFNLETEHETGEAHDSFTGLPSPAAAGTVVATILMYLSLAGGIEIVEGTPTPVGRGLAGLSIEAREELQAILLPLVATFLPLLGLLMVSRVRYPHTASLLFKGPGKFPNLVGLVFVSFLLYLAPVPVLFLTGIVYVLWGLVLSPFARRMRRSVAVEPEE